MYVYHRYTFYDKLYSTVHAVLLQQYCCNSGRAQCPREAPAPPKSGKTISHQPCPPQIWKKLFVTDPRDDGDGDDGGVTCDQQMPRFARSISIDICGYAWKSMEIHGYSLISHQSTQPTQLTQ